jgi:hypothetical protein
VEQTGAALLAQVLPFFRKAPVRIISDVTSYEEHAHVLDVGLLVHSRVVPLVWKVMPGQQKGDQGFWACSDELFTRLAPHVGSADGTVLGQSACGCFPMVHRCQKSGWHDLFRVAGPHTCQPRAVGGELGCSIAVSQVVREPGRRFRGTVRRWQDESIETERSLFWDPAEEEARSVLSDRTAGKQRLAEYRLRWCVESPFQDGKSRGWDGEGSHIRALDRVYRLWQVLFLLFWWLAHLAAAGIHHGKRDR